jgi:hypothetical protein
MGNIVMEVLADSYDAILLRLHAEDENDRYIDGLQSGLPMRVYRNGIAGIGPKEPITRVRPSIIHPGNSSLI